VKTYYVYIVASASRTLYTGVTNNLERRVLQHQRKVQPGFTAHYNINRLVYFETFSEILDVIAREKQIKSWGRVKKIALIEANNRDWNDLSANWYGSSSKTQGPKERRLQGEIPLCARNDTVNPNRLPEHSDARHFQGSAMCQSRRRPCVTRSGGTCHSEERRATRNLALN
jgi:putative endonuclease